MTRITDNGWRMAYSAYLASPEWRALRQQVLERDNHRCVECGSDGSDSRLEAHHLTYERFGHERPTDLQTLCHVCHSREHGRAPTAGLLPLAGPSQSDLTERAVLVHGQRRVFDQAERERQPLHERLRALEQAHMSGRIDLSQDFRVIRQRLYRLRKRAAA